MTLLIGSLKTFQPAEGDTHYHPFYRKVTLTMNRAAGFCQIPHLHPCLLAEAATPVSPPPAPQSFPVSRIGTGTGSRPPRCSAWVRARLTLGGIRRSIAEPTVFPDSFSHAALSLFLPVNVGQIFREHHSERRPSD